MGFAMAHCARRRGRATTGLQQNGYRLLGRVAGWLVGCMAGWLRGGVRLTGSSPSRQVALFYRPSPPLAFMSGPPKLEPGCNEMLRCCLLKRSWFLLLGFLLSFFGFLFVFLAAGRVAKANVISFLFCQIT